MYHGDALDVLPQIEAGTIDAVVTDPPYPEIDRDYGRLSEAEWHALMRGVVAESRRVIKPSGSAVFVLQPNSERVGRMRPWLWEFMAWTAREWNQIQDAWWWNHAAPPTVHCQRRYGLMRPSMKACVWLGAPDCYRNQDAVLWSPSDAMASVDREDRALHTTPSGQTVRHGRIAATADERGGVTPFNVIPMANTDSSKSGGASGHGAATPEPLCGWWTRYLAPPGGTVIDPFNGSGTTGLACLRTGHRYVGVEQDERYCEMAADRLSRATAHTSLFS